LKKSAFFDLHANQIVPSPDGKPTTIARLWFKSADRSAYERVVFDPSGKADENALNLWRGFPIIPKEGDWSLLRDHIEENVCLGDKTEYKWLLAWIAQIFQVPEKKLGSAVVIGGEKGTGKSKLAEWLSFLLKQYAKTVSQAQHVTGNFNAHMEQCLLLVAEEAFWAGSKQDEGALKHLITGKTITLERKGIDPVQIDNFTRLLVISNNDWIVPATVDERRFFVLKISSKHQRDTKYFAAIDEQMKNGGAEAMLHDLLELDISNVDLRNPPKTQWLIDQIEEGLSDVQAWIREMLLEGCLPHHDEKDYWGSRVSTQGYIMNDSKITVIDTGIVYESFVNFCRITRFHKPACKAKFGREIKRIIPELNKTRVKENGKRVYKYEFPSLSEVVGDFCSYTGIYLFDEIDRASCKPIIRLPI
ncbi:MAG: hypothetical protein DSY80_01130, partial [Desulfocapsa sp.]